MSKNKYLAASLAIGLCMVHSIPTFADSSVSVESIDTIQMESSKKVVHDVSNIIEETLDAIEIEQTEVNAKPETVYVQPEPVYYYTETVITEPALTTINMPYELIYQETQVIEDTTIQENEVLINEAQANYDAAVAAYENALAEYEAASQIIESTREEEVEVTEEVEDEEGNLITETRIEVQTVTETSYAGDVESAQANLDAAKASLDAASAALESAKNNTVSTNVDQQQDPSITSAETIQVNENHYSENEQSIEQPYLEIDDETHDSVLAAAGREGITQAEVEQILSQLISEYEWKNTWPQVVANTSNCNSFAHFVFNTIFDRGGTSVGRYYDYTEYRFDPPQSDIDTIASNGNVNSESELESMLELAAPGDWIQLKRRRTEGTIYGAHSLIVVGIDRTNNIIDIFDANTDDANTILHYSQTFSEFLSKNIGVSIYRYAGYHPYIPSNHNPKGVLDSCNGGDGFVQVRGWTFDPDDTNASIPVHVYIGGPTGDPNGVCYIISSSKSRPDVNNAYGIGGNHGFDETIFTNKRGSQPVYVYAINIGEGNDNPQFGSGTVTINNETVAPSITNVKITDISDQGFTISCTATDASGIDRVQFPTWTSSNGQDDLQSDWIYSQAARGSVNGDVWTYRVNKSDHKNETGMYNVHIYAYDKAGNSAVEKFFVNVNNPVNLGDSFYAVIRNPKSNKVLTNDADNVCIKTYNNNVDQIWKFERDSDNSYKITVLSSGKVLDLAGGVDQDSVNVQVYNSNDSNAQRWYFYAQADGTYEIMTKAGSRVIDIDNEVDAEGTNVKTYRFWGGWAQKYVLDILSEEEATNQRPVITNVQVKDISSTGYTVSCTVTDNIGIDRVQFPTWTTYNGQDDIQSSWWTNTAAAGTRDGNIYTFRVNISDHNQERTNYRTHIYAYDTSGNIRINVAPDVFIGPMVDLGTDFTAFIQNVALDRYATNEGNNVLSRSLNSAANQKRWKFIKNDDDTYTIYSLLDNQVLEVANDSNENETNVQVGSFSDKDTQKWYISKEENGYSFTPKCGAKVIDIAGGKTEEGINIHLYEYNGSAAQIFNIQKLIDTLQLTETSVIMDIGDTVQLEALVTPDDAFDKTIIWTSSDESVATVADGLITAVKDGNVVITASGKYGTGNATCDVRVKCPPVIKTSHTLSLEGNIGVNFYFQFSDDVLEDKDAQIELSVDGKSALFNVQDASIYQNYRRFTSEVTAAQMATDIIAKLILSGGNTVYTETYSVKQYCDNMLAKSSTDENLKNLMKALLNYGGYSQTYFKYNTDKLANRDLADTDVSDVTADTLSEYAVFKLGSNDGLIYKGSTLSLESLTSIRHYFTLEGNHTIDEYTFKLDGKTVTPSISGSMYYVEIPNVTSGNLDKMYTLTVGGFIIQYSALSYAYNQLNKTAGNAALQNVCRALYEYNQTANAYFEKA